MKNIFICIKMCFSSLWTQPPYNDINSLLSLIPPKLKQSQLSSHFDFGVNNQRSLPHSIPRLMWDPWARHRTPNCSPGTVAICCPLLRMCVCVCVCSLLCVCTWMGWMRSTNSEYGSPYLATHHFTKLIYACCTNHFTPDCFFEWGTIQGRF